jgi:hypothetical protein
LFCFLPLALFGQGGKTTPTITWAAPAEINYGTPLSATQLDATASVPGTFVYKPAAGTVLTPGTSALSVTFTPTDTTDYNSATASVSMAVGKGTPIITWAAPGAIAYGTALSSTQLNASASVAGTFSYKPASGAVLKAGAQALSVTFTPTNVSLYHEAAATVTLTVNKVTPSINWAAPAAIVYPAPLSATQLDAGANVPGAFVYTPAAGAVLLPGSRTLSVTFTPADATDYTAATGAVGLTVNMPVDTIAWPTPAAIVYGAALSATQLDATASVPGTFAYTPAAGTVLKAGPQTLSVTFTPTNTVEYAVLTATVTLTVNKATPTITWTTPAEINYGTPLSATQLDATSSAAGTFVYKPVSGTVFTPGTSTISTTFTPSDTADYNSATASVSQTVGKATPTIAWATPSAIPYGTALSATQLDASTSVPGTFAYSPASGAVLTAGSHTLSVSFTPANTSDYHVATATVVLTVNQITPTIAWTAPAAIPYGTALSATQLDASSTVAGTFVYTPAAGTVLKAGAQTLSATFTPTDKTDYATATATVGLTVNQFTPTIAWSAPAAIPYGTALSATQLDASSTVPGTLAYTPAAGTVLKAGAQTLSVKFTPTDTTDYTTATATVGLTVNQVTSTIAWTAPAAIPYGTALSATQLDASSPVPGTFTYTPAAGTVLKAGAQTLSVTFTPTDNIDYTTATATAALTVNRVTPTVAWTAPAAISYGAPLSATQLDASSPVAGTFAYTPAAGTVLKAGAQTLSVTFTPTDTTDYTTATATAGLTVNQATPAIAWTAPAAISYGIALSATQLDASSAVAGNFAYSPAAGTMLKAGAQTLSVTFTPTDTADYTTATASVGLTVNRAAPAIAWTAPAAISYGTALSATQLDASSPEAGAFAYSPAASTVLAAGAQTLSAAFTPTDTSDYSTVLATVPLTVNQVTPTITWATPAGINYGTALSATQLDATASVPGTFVYNPASGVDLPPGAHTLSVTFTPTDTTDYSNATATVTLAVGKATPTLTWPAPAAIPYGTALSATQLDATASVAGTFAYTPAAGTVLKLGVQTLSVTFTPTDTSSYHDATATVTLTVGQAVPPVSWATPAPIPYGTALSAAQLDASSTVAGTFAYTPAAGTVLNAGSQTLSVTFTPTNTTDYAPATISVSITVNPITPAITWPTPAPIPYGTALSATQLDATSVIPGAFVYTPPVGTVPPSGSQTLSVLFMPSDTTDYTTATQTVSLTVTCIGSGSQAAITLHICNDADDGFYDNQNGTGWNVDPMAGGADWVGSWQGVTTAFDTGYRFESTGIAQGQAIQSAYLQLVSSDGNASSATCGSAPCAITSSTFRVYGVAQDDGPPFSSTAGNTPLDVPYTTAHTDYTTTGAGDVHGSCQGQNNGQNTCTHVIDVTGIVQEVTVRPGWTNNSSMRFVMLSTNSAAPNVYAGYEDFSANPAKAATLLVNPSQPAVVSSGAWGTAAAEIYPTSYAAGPFVYPGASTLLLFLGDYYNFYNLNIPQPAVSDSCGNTWNILAGPTDWTGVIYNMRSTVYYVQNPVSCPAGDTITVTVAIQEPIFLHFLAIAGSSTSQPPIVSAIASPSPGAYTTSAASNPISLPGSGLLVSWVFADSDAPHTFTPQPGFLLDPNSTPNYLTAVTENVSSPGSYQSQFSISPSSDGWQAVLIGLPAPAEEPPVLTSLTPAAAVVGSSAQTLTLNGTSFLPASTVAYNGVGHTVEYVSSTELTIVLNAADLATTGSYPVVVTNPGTGGGASNVLNFAVGTGSSVTVSPASLNFANQPFLVTSPALTATLTNNGTAQVNIGGIVVGGANAGDFIQSNNCGSTLAAESACTVTITFFPRLIAAETATVTITDNAGGSPQTLTLTGTGIASSGQFMALDTTKTHLVNTFTGKPMYMTGDDAWDLIEQLDTADATTYLSTRASQGFNVVWAAAADNVYQSNPPRDFYGYSPFDGADFASEDASYWAHVDSILQLAASLGITVALDPGFVGYQAADGYLNSYANDSCGIIQAYGAWLGSRYADYPNIVWATGGDADYSTVAYSKLNCLDQGIRSTDSVHLLTMEACPQGYCGVGNTSTAQDWTSANVGSTPVTMNLNWVYNQYQSVQGQCAANYAAAQTAGPSLIGEAWYEGDTSLNALQVREEGYWGVLSGCTLGYMFGNDSIWCFNSLGPLGCPASPTWQNQLTSNGSLTQQYMGALMRSREFWKMVPDNGHATLTGGYGSGTNISVAARTSDGQTIIAYIPNGNATTVTINMSQITSATSTTNCWWYNPSTGAATLIGAYANSGSRNFTPPNSGDWVLVIDDASANLAAPGSANL